MESAALPERMSVANRASTAIDDNGRRMSIHSTASTGSQWSQGSTSHPHVNNGVLDKLGEPKMMVEFTASYAYDVVSYDHSHGIE